MTGTIQGTGIQLTAAAFFDTFPAAHEINTGFGRFAGEGDNIHWHYSNDKGEVAEVVYNSRTTQYTYWMLDADTATKLLKLYK